LSQICQHITGVKYGTGWNFIKFSNASIFPDCADPKIRAAYIDAQNSHWKPSAFPSGLFHYIGKASF
jgi:hypothetical protein